MIESRLRRRSLDDGETTTDLDGGGSTTLVHRGQLLNRPSSNQDQPAPQMRRVVTALALEPVA